MSERAWLVEWRFNGVQWLYLWPSAPGGFSFTNDASKALRFARREDAEAALQWARDTDAARRPIGSLTRHGLAMGEMLVTEHDWPALTAAPSAQAEPTLCHRNPAPNASQPMMPTGPTIEVAIGYAPPAAQVEPVRQLHSFSSIDCEKLIAATVPGGSACDPQEVADSIRRYLNAWPSAQAEPQVPLTDEQCDRVIAGMGLGYLVRDSKSNRDMLRELCRRAHGIGKQDGK